MTHVITPLIGRRALLSGAAALSVLFPRQSFSQARLAATPRQTEGPFYPVDWTGDIDDDLVVVKGEATTATGQVAHVEGRVLDRSGQPMAGAWLEIWQCDAKGVYRHPSDERGNRRHDAGFQCRGRAVTDASGRYHFRTIKPVAYPGRTPHIHFTVITPGTKLVTQLYVYGEPGNARDGVLNGNRDPRQRDSVIARFERADGKEAGALAASFDIVMG